MTTVEQDLAHLPELAAVAAIVVGLVLAMNLLHASDTLAYLMAVGILTAQTPWSPR
jgi:hypothetical protein